MGAIETTNKEQFRAYVQAWNDHDIEEILNYVSDDLEYAADSFREIPESWFEAFPNLQHTIEDVVAEEDRVLARLTLEGTHEGSFMGIEPTGESIEFADHFTGRFQGGEIVELNATADLYTLFEQVGVDLPGTEERDEANKAVVRRFFEALNDRDREAFLATMADEFTYGDIEGPEAMAANDWQWVEALDLRWHIEDMFAGPDFVTTQVRATGTHQGEILGLEPSGESFEVTALMIGIIEDDQLIEWRSEWDFAGLLNQIGAINSPVYDE